jgi:hypothetical protein
MTDRIVLCKPLVISAGVMLHWPWIVPSEEAIVVDRILVYPPPQSLVQLISRSAGFRVGGELQVAGVVMQPAHLVCIIID